MRFKALNIIILLVGVFCLLVGCGDQQQESSATAGVNKGTAAPDFTLQNMQGEEVKLSDLKGKVILLNFWATWCPPCREEMPSMEMLHRKYKDQGLVVLAVNVEQNGRALVDKFLKSSPYTFQILLDADAETQGLYKVWRFPESLIIDRSGNVVERVIGAVDWTSGPAFELIKALIKG